MAFVCENDLFVRLSLAQNQNVSYVCRQQFHFEAAAGQKEKTHECRDLDCMIFNWMNQNDENQQNRKSGERDMMKNRLNPMIIIVNKSVVEMRRSERETDIISLP